MGDKDGIDHRQDMAITLLGEFGGNAALAGSKGRNKQQRTCFDAGFKVSGYTVVFQATRHAEDGGMFATKEDAQHVFFHRCVKTADDGCRAEGGLISPILRFNNDVTGALLRAEKRCQLLRQ